MKEGETILWRRLDLPGHEISSIFPDADGWRLDGVAVLAESGRPCRIEYDISCDAQWKTRRCAIRGHIGEQRVSLGVERSSAGLWSIGGAEVTSWQADVRNRWPADRQEIRGRAEAEIDVVAAFQCRHLRERRLLLHEQSLNSHLFRRGKNSTIVDRSPAKFGGHRRSGIPLQQCCPWRETLSKIFNV